MSTKTTLKRIALVAVSALGFGMMSAVPSNATATTDFTVQSVEHVTSLLTSTDNAPVAGVNGSVATHRVWFRTSTTATSTIAINPSVILASAPSTSALAEDAIAATTPFVYSAPGTVLIKEWQFTTDGSARVAATSSKNPIVDANAGINGSNSYLATQLRAYYDVAGTYSWVFFNDLDDNGRVNGSEFSSTFTVVVGGSTASSGTSLKATVTPFNSTAAEDGTYGSLVRITLTDASNNPANVDAAGGIRVQVNGSAVVAGVNGNMSVTDAATYTLGANDFDGSGRAWVNITNGTAETVSLSLTGVGSAATSFTAPGSSALVFRTSIATGTTLAATSTTKSNNGTQHVYTTSGATTTAAFKTANVSATARDTVQVVDLDGKITGCSAAFDCGYDLSVAGDSTADATDPGSFSIAAAFTAAGQTYTLKVNGGSATTITATAAQLTTIAYLTPGVSYRAAAGSKQTVTMIARDQYTGSMANVTLTPRISGRNSTLVLSTVITGSNGRATWEYTDASTSTTSLVDTITFSSGAVSSTAFTVTYTSAANLGASKIILTTPSTSATTGAETVPAAFSAIKAGDGVETGQVSVVANVTDADGNPVLGVPVTFTVDKATAAITSTTKTVYSGSDGKATAKLYAWATGTYTVTATAGAVSDTAVSHWRQADPLFSRTVSAVVSGGSIIATVKDRLGNPVIGAPLKATRVGSGSFGGSSSATGTTGNDGTVEFILQGGSATVTVQFNPATGDPAAYAQTDAIKGNVDGNAAALALTAFTAGTATLDEEGVGASFDEAGVNSVSVTATGEDSAAAAADAAAEAIDAANAATDAANLAAEAADAATVAAEEARDAADAATAAVEELSTQVATLMAALRAQITTLANTVAKIAKKVRA